MKKYTKISIRLIVSCVIIIISDFIPDNFHEFFGDVYCKGSQNCSVGDLFIHGVKWHWGFRHFIFVMMGFGLALVQFIRMVDLILKNHEV